MPTLAGRSPDVVLGIEERFDNVGIPVFSRLLAENLIDLLFRHAATIRPIAGHRVIGVGHGHDPSDHGNIVAGESVRIAAAVPPFVVM